MPDYVYALHDFQPENEDEVDFRAGERIEVVEKDDLYGDGWWQVSRFSCSAGFKGTQVTCIGSQSRWEGRLVSTELHNGGITRGERG
jgi:Variant SH3 domain